MIKKNLEIFGKCANIHGHGHNYRLEVHVSGSIDENTGMVIDASKLDAIVQIKVMKQLDHKNLNLEVPWLDKTIVTSENLVEGIWAQLEPEIKKQAPHAHLQKIVLWETSRISVTKERQV